MGIIYPDNKIVVDYEGFEGVVIHGGYYHVNGTEMSHGAMSCFVEGVFGKDYISEEYEYNTLEELQSIAKTIDHNNEGFVVQFNNFQTSFFYFAIL